LVLTARMALVLNRTSRRRSRLPKWLTSCLVALAALTIAVEGYRGVSFIQDVWASQNQLLAIKDDLDVSRLQQSETDLLAKQHKLGEASRHLASASAFVRSDSYA